VWLCHVVRVRRDESHRDPIVLRPPRQRLKDVDRLVVVEHQPRVLAVDLSRVPDIEYSALQALMEGEKRLTEQGAVVWLVGLNPSVLDVVRHAGLDKKLGRERLLFNAREAIERFQSLQTRAEP